MGIVDWLYPRYCAGCGTNGAYICSSCIEALVTPPPICPQCCMPSLDGFAHARCTKSLGIDRLNVGLPYRGCVQKLLKQVKYKSAWDVLSDLSDIWCVRMTLVELLPEKCIVTSVPMYARKERERGFNQAEIFAQKVSVRFSLHYSPLLVRTRQTQPMFGLDKKERHSNISGAFAAAAEARRLDGMTVLLADDVWTTGSTIRECAKVLKRRGASCVWAATIAR